MKNEISQDLKEMSYGELQDLISQVLRTEKDYWDRTKLIQEINLDELKQMISSIIRECAWRKCADRLEKNDGGLPTLLKTHGLDLFKESHREVLDPDWDLDDGDLDD